MSQIEKVCMVLECGRKSIAKGLCNNHYVQKAYAKNRQKIRDQVKQRYLNYYGKLVAANYNPKDRRAKALWSKYRLTVEQFEQMEKLQNGLCAICFKGPTLAKGVSGYYKQFHVDHCHATGKIRGLLCATCNRALGGFQDNPDNLLNAIEYLKKSA